MVLYRHKFFIAFFVLMLIVDRNAFAGDNGNLKLELDDAAAAGMGDAFVGEADRASAVYFNPAGITQIDSLEVSAGLTWAGPQLKFSPTGGGDSSKMMNENFIFPNVFVTTPVIKDKLYIGLGESSDFGGGFDWESNSFSRYNVIKDSIADQDYRMVLAYKVTDQWSIGAGPINDQSHFEHYNGINQGGAPTGDGNALFKANDNAWGWDLGTIFKLNDQNQFGLNYKSPIHHNYDGTVYFGNLFTGAGLGGLLGASSFSTKATQKLTLPQSVTLGYNFKPTSKWTINFDLEWTDWSQYKQQTINYPDVSPTIAGALASSSTFGRDWTSVWSESLGVQYAVTDAFRVRAGYEHHQTPIPKATFDTSFYDANANAYTIGFGYDITKNLTIDVAYIADVYDTRNNQNGLDSSMLNGKYKAFVKVCTMSLTYKY